MALFAIELQKGAIGSVRDGFSRCGVGRKHQELFHDCQNGVCAYCAYLQGASLVGRPPDFNASYEGTAVFSGFYGEGIVDARSAVNGPRDQ